MRWLTRAAVRAGERLYTWGVVRLLAEDWNPRLPIVAPERSRPLVQRELQCIPEAVRTHALYHDAEVRIQTERLMRRYDLGQALNEAAQRAIEDKKTQVPPAYPTPAQERALKLQEQTLRERIRGA